MCIYHELSDEDQETLLLIFCHPICLTLSWAQVIHLLKTLCKYLEGALEEISSHDASDRIHVSLNGRVMILHRLRPRLDLGRPDWVDRQTIASIREYLEVVGVEPE